MDTSCNQVELRIEYVNGTLSSRDRGRFEHHLQHCQQCRSEVDQLVLLASSISALPVPEPSSDLADAVVVNLKDELYLQKERHLRDMREESSQFHWKVYALSLCVVFAATVGLSAPVQFGRVHEVVSAWLIHAVVDLSAQIHLSFADPSPAIHISMLLFGFICCFLIPLLTEEVYALLLRRHHSGRGATAAG
jgi:hypothetical protein